MTDKPTVFLVDADGKSREAVRTVVQTMNFHWRGCSTARSFLETYVPLTPGCLILEVRIPDINGLQLQDEMARRDPALPVVFLTSQGTVSLAVRAMRAGALHFLEKPIRDHELWDVIHEAIATNHQRRQTWARVQKFQELLAQLSPGERQFLDMLAEGHTKQSIAEALRVCVRTVEVRRTQIMKKLRARSMVDLVHYALLANGTLFGNGLSATAQS